MRTRIFTHMLSAAYECVCVRPRYKQKQHSHTLASAKWHIYYFVRATIYSWNYILPSLRRRQFKLLTVCASIFAYVIISESARSVIKFCSPSADKSSRFILFVDKKKTRPRLKRQRPHFMCVCPVLIIQIKKRSGSAVLARGKKHIKEKWQHITVLIRRAPPPEDGKFMNAYQMMKSVSSKFPELMPRRAFLSCSGLSLSAVSVVLCALICANS